MVEIEEVDDDYSAPAAPARHKHKKKSKKKVPDGTGGD